MENNNTNKSNLSAHDDTYFKPDNPDSLFDKFLQRKTHAPTELQLEKWEDEGGVSPEYNAEYGWFENDSFLKKAKIFFKRILEKISSNVAPRHLQTTGMKHHY